MQMKRLFGAGTNRENGSPGTELSPPWMLPDDAHNRELVANVHPPAWVNPTPTGRYNLVVLGAGTAGLVSAVGAASLGAKVAIVERQLLGGDCLNFGCVPSKGVLRAARAVYQMRHVQDFGIRATFEFDFAGAMERMRRLRATISHNDSARRLRSLGVDVYFGHAQFVGPDELEVDGRRLRFARAIIATGARAASLPVPGLEEAGYLTNETVFSLTKLPRRLVVIGAGPIGCELSQAFRRFGSEVTIVSLDPRLLPRADPDAAAILSEQFDREGIVTVLGAHLRKVEKRGSEKVVTAERDGGIVQVAADEILVAVGRQPNTDGLRLEAAGVVFDRTGIKVNDRLQTTNPKIYAAGDICSAYKFTHAADAMARIALQNALFFGRKKASALVIPWCTYTDPEVAHVGLTEDEARARGFDVTTLTVPLREVDRAILDGEDNGFARLHVERRSGRILGATMVAAHAGEMIGELSLALTAGLNISTLGQTIHPYPTQAEAWKKAADAYNRLRLTPRVRAFFEWFLSWRR
ncbi:MAG: mercuric reductase [Candidatus Binatia bacterium]|nr:MAG: mercuric reductase [Candidatus Binatia bacterium]